MDNLFVSLIHLYSFNFVFLHLLVLISFFIALTCTQNPQDNVYELLGDARAQNYPRRYVKQRKEKVRIKLDYLNCSNHIK